VKRTHVPRPTEQAALARAARRPAVSAPLPVLFAALLVAHAVRDREGMRLFSHAIVRAGGATPVMTGWLTPVGARHAGGTA
jgi:hypothetical protein